MAKSSVTYVCQSCGAVYPKWSGHCTACDSWNTITEEIAEDKRPKSIGKGKKGRTIEFVGLDGVPATTKRLKTGINELDRVCGGGLVSGSALLVGGDPGIGKSTILLQATAGLASDGKAKCVYISGEEAIDQIRMRAVRLGLDKSPVQLSVATSVRDIVATLDTPECPDVVVIDSIQTMYVDMIDSAPGTVSQVRASAFELIRLAKKRGFSLFLVGHVTKDGAIAGPRVLEHMVDTVLYFEGDRGHQFRILRGVKNRYGATDEIGVFEMTGTGLSEVPNPSELFLAERRGNISGSCVFSGIEGSRPVLVEIQALVAPSGFSSPKRAVVGWDSSRLSMLLAVLEARCGVVMSNHDVFLNVAGGLRIMEPAADLAVAAALVSSVTDVPVPPDTVVFGEVGLSGEVRAVAQQNTRLKEAGKLGFTGAFVPAARKKAKSLENTKEIAHLYDMVLMFKNGQ